MICTYKIIFMSIAVALSGGADSLLSLALMLEKNEKPFAVHGFFLAPDVKAIKARNKIEDLCSKLGVKLYSLDLSLAFKERVIEPFVQTYLQGKTPNPCALCNKEIKFGLLLEKALELGASKLATGHYAGLERNCPQAPGLFRGLDTSKEQSYFLSLLSKEQLSRACFPLKNWYKEQTFQELQRLGLRVPIARESQEICFIPNNEYKSFLMNQGLKLPGPGEIRDTKAKILGTHQGLWRYTLGQRRGLGIAYSEPLYVLDKDIAKNILIVGTRQELYSCFCKVKNINYLLPFAQWDQPVFVQTIYRQKAQPANVNATEEGLEVYFTKPRKPATPGQIAAFYSLDNRVLGAGFIDE